MQVLELLRKRHATRAMEREALPEETVLDLAEAARLTPSCYNKQPWRFLFAASEEGRAKVLAGLAEGNRVWADRAPLLVVAYARRQDDCVLGDGRVYYQFDLGMAVMNLMLCATEHGLVARPMAGFDPAAIREAAGLEADEEPLVVVAVGRPSGDESHLPEHYRKIAHAPRERKPIEDIVRWL